MINNIRLKEEKEHYDSLKSFFDSTISELILSHMADSYEKDLRKEMKQKFRPLEETVFHKPVERSLKRVWDSITVKGKVLICIDTHSKRYAKAYPTTNEETDNFIVLSTALLEEFSEDELDFIIGHEVSHIVFQHAVIRWITNTIYPEKEKIPPFIQNEINIWSQLAELSADRAGLFVCGNYITAQAALRKIDDIQKPSLQNRINCLKSDDFVFRFRETLIKELSEDYSELYTSFLEKASILMGQIDGHLSSEEEVFILNRISRYRYFKKDFKLNNFESIKIDEILEEGKKIAEHFPEKVKEIFLNLAVLALKDQKLSREEYQFLNDIGIKAFGFSIEQIDEILISIIRSKFFVPYNEL